MAAVPTNLLYDKLVTYNWPRPTWLWYQKGGKLQTLETNVPIALELDQESPSSPISHKVCQIHQDSSSPRVPESTSSPDETLLSTDSCCKNKTIEVLPKQGELYQIKEPERKSQSDTLQIQNPAQNPDLDFVQQLADGTVRLSLTLLMVSKNKSGLGSWIKSVVGLTDWLPSSSEGLSSLLWWEVFSKHWILLLRRS